MQYTLPVFLYRIGETDGLCHQITVDYHPYVPSDSLTPAVNKQIINKYTWLITRIELRKNKQTEQNAKQNKNYTIQLGPTLLCSQTHKKHNYGHKAIQHSKSS